MTAAPVVDCDTIVERLASLDLTAGVTARERRNARRVFHRLAEQLPAGVVGRAWDLDLLTVEQHDAAVRWRRSQGLEP
jgi:hypothetical protein